MLTPLLLSLTTASHALCGVVLDTSGAPVPGASVTVETAGREGRSAQTGGDGRFVVADLPVGDALLAVSASGFAPARMRVTGANGSEPLRIVLQPAMFAETVSVTASRGAERLETPASVSVLRASELLTTAAGTVDDALRATPGFSLFRRSSSRVANPTTQGVTLRGVSGSGASRTLVLADGFPLNDPFGSWVYWNRLPLAAVDRVEVVRGTAGDLYGAEALGGVVQILTHAADRTRLRALADAASRETGRVSVFGSGQWHGWTGSLSGEWLATGGAPVVARAERGPVDVPADSDYRTAFASVGRDAGSWRAMLRGSVYGEDRGNGTPLQVNTTDWRQLSGEAGGALGGGAWLVRGAFGSQEYSQTFSAVSPDRSTERLTAAQRAPTSFASFAGQWARPWGSHGFLAGVEGRRARSTNHETRHTTAGVPLAPALSGGTERIGAVFARASLAVGRLRIGLGARGEFWDSDPRDAASPAHSARLLSPRLSLSWRANGVLALHASASRGFRTPTLNELYREFRVGNAVTSPNPRLDPERLSAAEVGLLFSKPAFSARVTGFVNDLDDAVANVTLRATPSLITRQRQNAGRIRAGGVEVEADLRPHPRLALSAVAVWTDARFRGTSLLPALADKRVPQVPRYQFGLGASFADARTLTLTAQVRLVGPQFDDDLNQFELRSFAVVDASASRSIGGRLHGFVAVENLFDVEYDAGRTPVRTVGWPRTVRGGLRFFWP